MKKEAKIRQKTSELVHNMKKTTKALERLKAITTLSDVIEMYGSFNPKLFNPLHQNPPTRKEALKALLTLLKF